MSDFIPFSRPTLGEAEYEAVRRIMDSGWLTVGDEVREFEGELARRLSVNHVVAVDSCTSALTLALKALDAEAPPVALVPALTFAATANAAIHAGYEVQFCDVDDTGCIDVNALHVTPDAPVSVILPVHFAGQPCELVKLWELRTPVIEDAAHALGATLRSLYHG